ncbi:MAG: OmpH family outer membrane protein [Bacteroidales bacterium]|jgi:outer membrane protein|nr:OmpH family outer membrane protein [Bacteroidales bacterium]
MKKILLIVAVSLIGFSASAQKFAHVNFQELVQLMPESDQARSTIQESQKAAQESYQEMMNEFQDKYAKYQQNVNSYTPATRKTKEDELTQLQQRIQEFSTSVEAELQEQQQKLMEPIYKKAQEKMNEVAKAGGYIYVFDRNSLLYVDETQSTDITPECRKALGIPAERTLESLQAELAAKAAAAANAQ